MNSINNFKNELNYKLIKLNNIQKLFMNFNEKYEKLNELINKTSFNSVIKNELNINFDKNINLLMDEKKLQIIIFKKYSIV